MAVRRAAPPVASYGHPPSTAGLRGKEHVEQVADLSLLDEGMPQAQVRPDHVVVPSSGPLALYVALLHQVGQDLVGGALGDPYGVGDIPQADAGIVGNAQQDVGVVRQEVPAPDLKGLASYSGTIVHEYRI
jgi:hypothetical protein